MSFVCLVKECAPITKYKVLIWFKGKSCINNGSLLKWQELRVSRNKKCSSKNKTESYLQINNTFGKLNNLIYVFTR